MAEFQKANRYAVEVMIRRSPDYQFDTFLIETTTEEKAKTEAMNQAFKKWGTAIQVTKARELKKGEKFNQDWADAGKKTVDSVEKTADALGKELSEKSGLGKYEIKVRISKSWKLEETYTIDSPSEKEARLDAIAKATSRWSDKVPANVRDIEILSVKTLRQPEKETTFTKVKDAGEKGLEWVSIGTDIAGIIAELAKFGKLAAKLDVGGKVLSGISLEIDKRKMWDLMIKLSQTTNKKVQEDIIHDMCLVGANMAKTGVATAFPPAGLVDLAATLFGKYIDIAYISVYRDFRDERDADKKAEYDRQKYALKSDDAWYEDEWKLYVRGVSMADIIDIRRTKWLTKYNPCYRQGYPNSGPQFNPTYGSGEKVPGAKSAAKGVTVSFDANGGDTPNPASKSVNPGSAYGTLATVSKAGHKFDGWFTLAKGGMAVIAKTTVDNENAHKLYAHWIVKSVRVSFDARGGNPNPPPRDITFGSAYGDLPNASKAGNNFLGWFTDREEGTPINARTKVDNEKNHTLYARWSPIMGMTLTFNANRGDTPNPKTKVVNPGSAYGALATVSRSGYKFDGWYTKATGGTKVEPKSVATGINTLYAHWIAPSVTVSFDARGGTPSPAGKSVDLGSAYGTLPTVSKTGYKFFGWFTEAYTGTEVKPSTKVTEPGKHKLYAHWTSAGITVSFDASGGKPSPASKEVNPRYPYDKLPTVSKTGYKFEGWFTSAKGGTEVKTTTKAPDKSHTLYAHWTEVAPKKVTVTFDASGGKPSPASKSITPGTAYGTLPTVTKDKYKFEGWFTSTKSGTKVTSSTKAPDKSHTLYAHWTNAPVSKVKVTFDANGGKAPSPASKSATPGTAYGTLPTVTKDKYKFEGWFTSTKSGTKVTSSTKAPDKNQTLYAHWTAAPASKVKVTFNANGGKPSPASKEVKAGTAYGALPTVSKTGSKFEGWYTAAKGGTKAGSSAKAPEKNHTLYAHWTDKKPTPPPKPTPKPTPKPIPPKPTPPPPKPIPPNAGANSFFPTKAGTVLIHAQKNAGGNTESYSVQTIKDVKGSGKNMTVTFGVNALDKNRKPYNGSSGVTYKVIIKDGVVVMDIKQMLPAELQSQAVKMEAKGTPVEMPMPNNLKPGQSLKPSNVTITMDVGVMKMNTLLKTEEKCLAIEDVKVPAGTFRCHKVIQKNTTTAMGISTVETIIAWWAPNIGQVKTETYDDRNKLISSSVLVEIKGR